MASPQALTTHDDLGRQLSFDHPIERVVSLVPSLTEAIAYSEPELLVGATDWCTHPAELGVPRVGGTKSPDIDQILSLNVHLVIASKEENRQCDVGRLQEAGLPVWVTDIEDVPGALCSLGRILEVLSVPSRACRWLTEAQRAWSSPTQVRPGPPVQVLVPIWRRPWMCLGPKTYAADVLRRLGVQLVSPPHPGRYPVFSPEEVGTAYPAEVALLPDEPYPFSAHDGPEAFSLPVAFVAGRALTWYGPAMIEAPQEIVRSLRAVSI
ncbi:helical backbone metal receptor [Austwickia chelonae]|uniref:helical backbone metal receptor n=1 Tax=Austwickia chelonae TaxID=100225 RepID=UPI000E251D5C|nr:helical backbone metal receptor [Austwickia chelonae]